MYSELFKITISGILSEVAGVHDINDLHLAYSRMSYEKDLLSHKLHLNMTITFQNVFLESDWFK